MTSARPCKGRGAWSASARCLPTTAPPAKARPEPSSGQREVSDATPERDTQALALQLSRGAREHTTNTAGEAHLLWRGIRPERLPPHGGLPVLRWSSGLRWHADRGLLVIAVNGAEFGIVRSAQTIALNPDGTPVLRDGRKAKRTYGQLRGSAVRFGWQPDYERGQWGVGEGVETSLCAAARMLGNPCWASLGASGMPHVRPPSWARVTTVVADHDQPGLAAAAEAARQYRALGLAVRIIRASQPGADLADLAQRETAHA